MDERLEFSWWELQVTALSRFYDWAEHEVLAAAVPFTVATGRRMVQGRLVETRHNRARLPRPKPYVKVQYLESDFAGLFRYGLAGLGPDGLEDATFRGRFPGRNAAMSGLALGTGMRNREFTHLLVHEVEAGVASKLGRCVEERDGRGMPVSFGGVRLCMRASRGRSRHDKARRARGAITAGDVR
ncbi:hypothetical protein [Streptomyces sp. NPDC059278]|uniref:hypothetical protein n=1 Tax=Streptomyces sp. NPDC059278 TaxID=3346801 RepID=UPI00369CFC95